MSEAEIFEQTVLEETELEGKISASKKPGPILTARNYLQECVEVAQLLPPPKRALFMMYYSHNLTKLDISKVCNCSPGAVGVRLAKINQEIHEMRNCMRDDKNELSEQKTRMRIEAYFRAQKNRGRSTNGSEDSTESL